jgi:hypothetical protein
MSWRQAEVMKDLRWIVAYSVRDSPENGPIRENSLLGLRTPGTGWIIALGTTQSLISRDCGITWKPFFEIVPGPKRLRDVITSTGEDFVFAHCDGQTSLWRGQAVQDRWAQLSCLPGAVDLSSGFLDEGKLVVGLNREDSLQVFASNDRGTTWDLMLEIREFGAPAQFVIDPSGIALCVFLEVTEMLNGTDFQSNLVVLDLKRKQISGNHSVRANIQSVCACGKGAWLLGGNSGLVFRYGVGEGQPETYLALEREHLDITGIHMRGQDSIIVAEESEPSGGIEVFMARERIIGPRIKTEIRGFAYGSAWIKDAILILTPEGVYRYCSTSDETI